MVTADYHVLLPPSHPLLPKSLEHSGGEINAARTVST